MHLKHSIEHAVLNVNARPPEKPGHSGARKEDERGEEITALMGKCVESGQSLLIIAEDIDADLLTTLLLNRLRRHSDVCGHQAKTVDI